MAKQPDKKPTTNKKPAHDPKSAQGQSGKGKQENKPQPGLSGAAKPLVEQSAPKSGKSMFNRKSIWIGAAVNGAATYYTFRKSPKLAIPAALLSAAWSVASAAVFKSWDSEAENAQGAKKPEKQPDTTVTKPVPPAREEEPDLLAPRSKDSIRNRRNGGDKKGPGPQ